MNRLVYSVLLAIAFIFTQQSKAQVFNFTFTPNVLCYNGPGTYTVGAAQTASSAGATNYNFNVTSSIPTCQATWIMAPGNGTACIINFPCCGTYTVTHYAYNTPTPAVSINQAQQFFTLVCPTSGTITSSSNTVCMGAPASLTANGAASYTWFAQTGTTAPVPVGQGAVISVTPTSLTSYTVIGTTAAGCTVSATKTLAVQKATFTVSPASLTVCPGAPIALTSTTQVTNGGNFTSGTASTQVQWFNPANTQIGSTANITTTASAGIYTAVVTHTGAAGTCTLAGSVNVSTISTIPVTVTANAASVCPGAAVILNAGVTSTPAAASASITWVSQAGASPTVGFSGSPVTRNPTAPTSYTVNINYYGCTGTNTISVGMSTITPTLTASSPSSCPGKSITLTASGGISYTLTAYYANFPGFGVPVNTLSPGNIGTVSPSANQLSFGANTASFVVNALANGCTGSSTITVGKLTLNTQLVANSLSVCPNTSLCLNTTNGCGTTNTITFITYSVVATTTNCSPSASAACFNAGNIAFFPLTFSVSSDSAGCKGTANLTVYKRDLVTNITPSSYSICPETAVCFTTSNGAGTNYTWTAPYTAPNSTASSVFYNGTSSTVCVNTQSNPTLPYTYTVAADSAGCEGTNQITIGLLTLTPTLTASAASICPGSNFTLNSTGGAGTNYTFTADYVVNTPTDITLPSSGNTATGTVPNNSNTFPHNFVVNVDSSGCVGTASVQIGLLNLTSGINLNAFNAYSTNSTTPTSSMCPGRNFTLVATNSNTTLPGATSFTFYALPSTQIPNITASTAVTSSSAFPITYIVYADNSGCVGTQTLTINELFITNLVMTASPTMVCAGMPTTLSALSSGTTVSAPGVTYNWAAISPTAAPLFTSSPTIVVNPTVNTTYAVVMDSLGCKTGTPPGAAVITVSLIPSLTLTPSATNYSVCAGLPTTLSVISGTVPSVSYTWTSNSGTFTPGAPPSTSAIAIPSTATQYTIDGKDALGCVGSTVVTIGIDPLATLSVSIASPMSTICSMPGVSTTLTASCSINPVTYSWSPNVGLSATNTDSVIVTTNLNIQNFAVYTATADNGWGCRGTASYTVNLVPIPQPTIIPTSNGVCAGYTSTLTAFGATSYTWTSASFTNAVAQQSLSVGAGTYSVLGSNGGGCTAIASIPINTLAPLQIFPQASTPTTCIENNTPKYSKPVILTASGAQNYVWFPYNPTHMTYSLGPSTTVRPPATTIYTVIGSSQVCSGSQTLLVTVIPQFTMNVVPPLPYMCIGDSLKLSITNIQPTLAVGPASAFSYSWTEAANAPPISISSKFTSTVLVWPQNTTTYSTEVRDSRSCVSLPRLVTVTVLPRPIIAIAIPTINNVPTNTLCYVGLNPGPDDVVLTLTGTNKNTNLQFGVVPTYTWISPYDSKHNSILTPVNNNAVTISAPLRLPTSVTYTLRSGYNGVQGCITSETVEVEIVDCRPVTAVSFTTAEKIDTICSRNCITFINTTDTAAGGPQNILWTFKGGNPATSTNSVQTVCYNLPGKYDVILTVANPYPKSPPNGVPAGSSNNLGVQSYVKVVDIPNVTIVSPGQLRSDTIIRFGTPISVKGSGAIYYNWSPNYNITSLTDPNVTMTPFKSTEYILTGRNSKNCYSSDTLNVIVVEDCGEMYVPNAFTPNNDGVNDVLYVRGICLKSLTFMVFNRWGEKVFETADQRIGWDGSYKGEDLNTGVYVFRLEGKTYDGKQFSAKGNITLMR